MHTPIMQARDLLQGSARGVQKVAVIITDGYPNDPADTAAAIRSLLATGAWLLFVKVGTRTSKETLFALVSGSDVPLRNARVDLVEASDYDRLEGFVPEVMRRLVKVTQVVRRARANI